MRKTILTLFALAGLASAPSASAYHTDGCPEGTAVPVGDAAYVVIESVAEDDVLFSVWIVLESNGEPGYQCGDAGDTVIF